MRIIAFIDQPNVNELPRSKLRGIRPIEIKKILKHSGLWEDSHAPPDRSPPGKELTFDPSSSQMI